MAIKIRKSLSAVLEGRNFKVYDDGSVSITLIDSKMPKKQRMASRRKKVRRALAEVAARKGLSLSVSHLVSLFDLTTDTYYLAVCPECNKYLEYTIDAKVDYLYNIEAEDIGSKMKQAASVVIAEHNSNIQKHSARLVEYKFVEDSKTEKAEALRQEKISILKSIMSLV